MEALTAQHPNCNSIFLDALSLNCWFASDSKPRTAEMYHFQLFLTLLILGVNSSWELRVPPSCKMMHTTLHKLPLSTTGLCVSVKVWSNQFTNKSLRDYICEHFFLWLLSSLQLGHSYLSPWDIVPFQLSESRLSSHTSQHCTSDFHSIHSNAPHFLHSRQKFLFIFLDFTPAKTPNSQAQLLITFTREWSWRIAYIFMK